MNWLDKISFFNSDFHDVMDKIGNEITAGKTIFPKPEEMLNAYMYTSLNEVKVVILGQDPYYNGTAHGLCFSVTPDTKPLPKSLQNIFKELVDDIDCKYPSNGSLIPWAKQGVFLLNTSLSVEATKPNSHQDFGWGGLVSETLKTISSERKDVVFILWGANAQAKKFYIDKRKHFIVESPHPSPLSAYRGFFGSKPFSKTNDFLLSVDKKPIDWDLQALVNRVN